MYRRTTPIPASRQIKSILIVVAIFLVVVGAVDKLVLEPSTQDAKATTQAEVVDQLRRHDVKRATIAATTITIELNDGTTRTETVPADRDLWPALRESGADLAIAQDAHASATPAVGYAIQFVPFTVMALLLLFVLNRAKAAKAYQS